MSQENTENLIEEPDPFVKQKNKFDEIIAPFIAELQIICQTQDIPFIALTVAIDDYFLGNKSN